jgi:molybdopterin molybdotransferase
VSEGELWASLHPNQSSGVLSSVSWANALAVIPPDTTVARGDAIELLLLESL